MIPKYSEPAARPGRASPPHAAGVALATLLLAAAFMGQASCARRESDRATAPEGPAGQAPQPPPQASSPPQASPPTRPGPAASRLRSAETPIPRTRRARPSLAASIRSFGLGSPLVARLPEDYSIGPLQDYRVAGKPEAAPLALAESFLKGLAAGKLDAKLLAPHSREALAMLLAPEAPARPGEGDQAHRLGRIVLEGDSASLRVTLASAPGAAPGAGRIEGYLALGRFDDSWYVEALSLDPPAAGEGEGTARPSFDPYRRGSP